MSATAIIIPARFNSSRFPGKSLEMIDEFNVIQTVFLQAQKVKNADKVIVATDDERIIESVRHVGGTAILTKRVHENGTSRIAEVAESLNDFKYIINLQGDEPFIKSDDVELIIEGLKKGKEDIVTLRKECNSEEFLNPNCVKVVTNMNGRALYFSRSGIPHGQLESISKYKHIGIYGFKRKVLLELVKLEPVHLEQSEKLEQLRWLEYGYNIQTIITEHDNIGIDVPADILRARKFSQSII